MNQKVLRLQDVPIEELATEYYSMTTEQFSERYKVSKTVWLPYLRQKGIKSKKEERLEHYPGLSSEQVSLLIGSLLGDGGIDCGGRYYEFHCIKQEQYLRMKHRVMSPFSKNVFPTSDGTGYSFRTISHPCFYEFRELFYKTNVKGKLIPIDFIKDNWHESILAYWFFDDGTIDDETGECTICNKGPFPEQLNTLKDFLEDRYGWGFYCSIMPSIYRISFSKKYRMDFGNILLKYATPDMYTKIPEESLSEGHIRQIGLNSMSTIKPKLYRKSDESIKCKIEATVFDHFRKRGFPFINITDNRLNYLYDSYKKVSTTCVNGTIQHNTSGLKLCEYFFPNIYECKRKGFSKAPVEYWEEDDFLHKFVHNRLTYADRITDSSMRTGIKLSKICVSNFKPAVANYLYKKYAVNGNVLDYSCGFGSRMLAAMSLGLNYVGYEPAVKTYSNLLRFGSFLKQRGSGNFDIKATGSETELYAENYFGFAFSSPPYFDFEEYSKDPGQSIVKYQDYETWLVCFWKKVMENCYRSLTSEGFFGVCLSPSVAGDLIRATFEYAKDLGFFFDADYRVLFRNVFGGRDKAEIVLVFSKKPSSHTPRFLKDGKYVFSYSEEKEGVFFDRKSSSRRVFYSDDSYEKAKELLKEYSKTLGVSRTAYEEGNLLGVPAHCIEYRYKGWNNFIRAAGLDPQYELTPSSEVVKSYFKMCLEYRKVLSFYEFGKIAGDKNSTKIKRLFNAGKPYSKLKLELSRIALHPDKHQEFLSNFL